MSAAVPFVVGQWVWGPNFYGREAELARLQSRPRSWIVGLRRSGKTSLLRQLDHLARVVEKPILPLFWDLQGADDASELGLTLLDALLDAGDLLEGQRISAEELRGRDLFATLARLRDSLSLCGARLLLLCDEADELIGLSQTRPDLVTRLWRAISELENAGVVLASSVRLYDHFRKGEQALDFLETFGPTLYLGALCDADAESLIRQTHLPRESRPRFADVAVKAICARCGGHPLLLQLLGKRFLESGDLETAWRQATADGHLDQVFTVDFEMLTAEEQSLLRAAADAPAETVSDDLTAAVQRLLGLGLLRASGVDGWRLGNDFLADWLRRKAAG